MLRYINTDIVFQEIPDEVTLAINISNCPCHCPGCHSKFLWADTGIELDEKAIDSLMAEFGSAITCISFMGGDAEPDAVDRLAGHIRCNYPECRIAWYSGRTVISQYINHQNFDYIKVGPYIEHLGPLNSPKTNQRLYRIHHHDNAMDDITSRFWKK